MTVPVERPPAADEETRPAAASVDPPAKPATSDKSGLEDHAMLLAALVAACVLLAFAAMIVLTELGGGSGYVPWNE